MRRCLFRASAAACLILGLTSPAHCEPPAGAANARPFGIEKRTPWTTSRVRGSPEPPAPYRLQAAFVAIKFYEPLELTGAPGVDRLFVAERRGRIYSFANDPQVEQADLLVDIGRTVYGLAFHPQFKTNGYFYVTSVLDPMQPQERGTRVSRFQVNPKSPLTCDPKSEVVLIEWLSGGHNGGCLAFGSDGYLYIATGDGSGIADEHQTGQDVSDLLSSILRIDVDHLAGKQPYSVPKDNPFVGVAGARPEIWAYGVRQPWKFTFDSATGQLWAGDVGQDLWESVLRIERGGNYGWSVREAMHPFRPERKSGPSPVLDPVVEHNHAAFRSITGGHVYRGSRLPELEGTYIYGDYDTGRVWGLRYQGDKVGWHKELVDTPLRIIDFGEDQAGEIYLLDFMGGGLHRLVPSPPIADAPEFPRKLSETGLFASTADHEPAPGLIPYSVNAPLWSDGAEKDRFLALPGDSQIEFDKIEYPQPAPGAPRGWKFPDGTVVVKTFYLEQEQGNPASRRRLETRILHYEQLAGTEEVGDQYWHGYTYVWNAEQTDAELLDSAGASQTFKIRDAAAPGGEREQTWRFPSRAECTLCHTMPAKYVLGLNTLQMNRDHDYGGAVDNQLRTLAHLGVFSTPLPAPPEELPRLVDYRDESQALDRRARSYLHANCAHCHMKWGGGNADFQLLYTLDVPEMGIVGTRPSHGALGLQEPAVLTPGEPDRTMIYRRMTLLGLGRMPHVASSVVDRDAVKLIRDWIEQLPSKER